MARGNVKWFNADKGYGFIAPSDGSRDVFVHRNNIVGLRFGEGLKEGEEVEYEVENTPKGMSAVNVERVAE
jgi:CspA family cold shock protein